MVQCKFKLIEKTEINHGGGSDSSFKVKFTAVQHGTFGEYTPSGSIEFFTTNVDAYNQFETGKEYLVDFHE